MSRSTQQCLVTLVQQLSILQERMTRLTLELEQMKMTLESRGHQGPPRRDSEPPRLHQGRTPNNSPNRQLNHTPTNLNSPHRHHSHTASQINPPPRSQSHIPFLTGYPNNALDYNSKIWHHMTNNQRQLPHSPPWRNFRKSSTNPVPLRGPPLRREGGRGTRGGWGEEEVRGRPGGMEGGREGPRRSLDNRLRLSVGRESLEVGRGNPLQC